MTVPIIISTKDLSYFSDMFEWNFTLAKKCHHYMEEVQTEKIKQELQATYELHKNICERLVTILGGFINE